ncbi:MAG TPA: threonine-phosphate decarboxylase CobD [Azospirillum sp.]|nr:threonine-phosphate decarboxylase CobD [Azospirillum sp.]
MAETVHSSNTVVPENILHGGDLDAARAAFPGAPEPWLDLSTGINPWSYPIPAIPIEAWTRLPGRAADEALRAAAVACYGAPSAAHVVAAAGSQALIQVLPRLRPLGRVAVLGPTYAEHARGWSAAGHAVAEVRRLEEADGADVVVIVNPNNPDGRVVPAAVLLDLARRQAARGGWLVVDEAFADAMPEVSMAAEADRPGLVVLRSFGKFFGLAGVRLGFALGRPELADAVRRGVGPWAVSGPALAVGAAALSDRAWIETMRQRLVAETSALDVHLQRMDLSVSGGTPLFRLVTHDRAQDYHRAFGRAGILVRRFPEHPGWLRMGLPPDEAARERLAQAGKPGAKE